MTRSRHIRAINRRQQYSTRSKNEKMSQNITNNVTQASGGQVPRLRSGPERGRAAEEVPPPLFAVRTAHAAGWLSSLVLPWVRVLRAVRSSASRTAIAAGSSTRSGRPCLSRERRASSAPAMRISVRSSGLSGRRGGRRVSCLPARRHSPSSVPAWSGSCQSWGITSPKRLAGVTSPPFRCGQIRLGTQRYATGSRWVIVPRCSPADSRVAPLRVAGGSGGSGVDSIRTLCVCLSGFCASSPYALQVC